MNTALRTLTLTGAAEAVVATGFAAAPAQAHESHGAHASGASATATAPTGPTAGTQASPEQRRATIIERANFWAKDPVPYSMERTAADPNGKQYRADCSGFVSMAWGLKSSLSTVTLPDVAHPIKKDELKPGDILLKGGPGTGGANGHVAIFNGWADDSHTKYHGIEQAGRTGTAARDIAFPYDQDSSYVPYRLNGL